MTAIVYQITNLVNGKRYIGITSKTLARRKAQHVYEGRRGTRGKIYAAMRLYGVDLFRFRALKTCASVDEAKAEEIRLIASWKPQYNIAAGGEGAFGHKMPRAIVERIAAKQRGRIAHNRGIGHTPEALAKMKVWRDAHPEFKPNLGKRHPEMGAKVAAALKANGTASMFWKGKKRSLETVSKILATKKLGPKISPTKKVIELCRARFRVLGLEKSMPIVCVSDGIIFPSAKSADQYFGLSKGAASQLARKGAVSLRGLRFEYWGVRP